MAELAGTGSRAALYPILSHNSLYRVVERSHPATADEHVGLLHLTAIDTLARDSAIPIDEAHAGIVAAIDALDPPLDEA